MSFGMTGQPDPPYQTATRDVRIRLAVPKDLPAILRIAKGNALGCSPLPVSSGFLVSGYNAEQYLELCSLADCFYVVEEPYGIVGFLLAYSLGRAGICDPTEQAIRRKDSRPFILAKQVCVEPNFAGKGYGQRLYRHLFKTRPTLPTVAAIVVNPLNLRSIQFHDRLGFVPWFETTPEDGLKRSVWRRKPQSNGVLL